MLHRPAAASTTQPSAELDALLHALNRHADELHADREARRRAMQSMVREYGYAASDTLVYALPQSQNTERITAIVACTPVAGQVQLLGSDQLVVYAFTVPIGTTVIHLGEPGILLPPDTVRKLVQTAPTTPGMMSLLLLGFEVPNRGDAGGAY